MLYNAAEKNELLACVAVDGPNLMDAEGTVPTGYELIRQGTSSLSLSYSDLGKAMVEIGQRREEFEGKAVGVSATGMYLTRCDLDYRLRHPLTFPPITFRQSTEYLGIQRVDIPPWRKVSPDPILTLTTRNLGQPLDNSLPARVIVTSKFAYSAARPFASILRVQIVSLGSHVCLIFRKKDSGINAFQSGLSAAPALRSMHGCTC